MAVIFVSGIQPSNNVDRNYSCYNADDKCTHENTYGHARHLLCENISTVLKHEDVYVNWILLSKRNQPPNRPIESQSK